MKRFDVKMTKTQTAHVWFEVEDEAQVKKIISQLSPESLWDSAWVYDEGEPELSGEIMESEIR